MTEMIAMRAGSASPSSPDVSDSPGGYPASSGGAPQKKRSAFGCPVFADLIRDDLFRSRVLCFICVLFFLACAFLPSTPQNLITSRASRVIDEPRCTFTIEDDGGTPTLAVDSVDSLNEEARVPPAALVGPL